MLLLVINFDTSVAIAVAVGPMLSALPRSIANVRPTLLFAGCGSTKRALLLLLTVASMLVPASASNSTECTRTLSELAEVFFHTNCLCDKKGDDGIRAVSEFMDYFLRDTLSSWVRKLLPSIACKAHITVCVGSCTQNQMLSAFSVLLLFCVLQLSEVNRAWVIFSYISHLSRCPAITRFRIPSVTL